MINSKTTLFALLGNPVSHSLSPLMQNVFLQQNKINAVYLAFNINSENLKETVYGLHSLGVRGCNVTIPHKEAIISYLKGLTDRAKVCGAVNTLIYTEDGYIGDNTDGSGLLMALYQEHQWQPSGKSVLLIGAGGAAKGIAVALVQAGVRRITIANRNKKRAQELVDNIKSMSNTLAIVLDYEQLQKDEWSSEVDTVIQTTPIGMHPNTDEMPDISLSGVTSQHLIVDIIYNPKETKLLKIAKENGAAVSCGLGMFLYQGALAFEQWTNASCDVKPLYKLLDEELTKGKKWGDII